VTTTGPEVNIAQIFYGLVSVREMDSLGKRLPGRLPGQSGCSLLDSDLKPPFPLIFDVFQIA
jgi:hypothetical protein